MIKVIDNALRKIPFKKVDRGATIKYGDNYYIVMPMLIDVNGNRHNAVNLATGAVNFFGEEDHVIPFNCELIVL